MNVRDDFVTAKERTRFKFFYKRQSILDKMMSQHFNREKHNDELVKFLVGWIYKADFY